MSKISYKKTTLGGMMAEPILEIRYKDVLMTLAEDNDWISIYSVLSKNPGKGEVSEMIDLIKKDFPNKKLYGSVPLNSTMKHIYDKKGVNYGRNI